MLSFAVTLVCMVLTFLLAPLLTIILLPLFFYSFSWFCTVFTCYPIIKKYIIVPALEAQAQAEGTGDVKPEEGLTESSEELKTEDGEK